MGLTSITSEVFVIKASEANETGQKCNDLFGDSKIMLFIFF